MTKTQAERDSAHKEASAARENAAKLRGQVEALQTQADQLCALAMRQYQGRESEAKEEKTIKKNKPE